MATIYDMLPVFTRKTDFSFAAVQWADGEYRLGAEQIEIMERTADPLLERLGYGMNSTREENFAFASLLVSSKQLEIHW